jgi:molybdate transport system ATP-binding protein
MFYVSHDLEEVVRIADDMLYLEEGRLRAAGSLADLLLRLDLPLSRGHDAVAVLHTVVSVHDDPYLLTRLDFPAGHITVSRQPYPVGRRVRVHIHARDVSITLRQSSDTSILNILPTRILEMVEVEEGQTMLKLGIDGLGQTAALLARITRKSSIGLGLRVGMQVYAQIKSVALLD